MLLLILFFDWNYFIKRTLKPKKVGKTMRREKRLIKLLLFFVPVTIIFVYVWTRNLEFFAEMVLNFAIPIFILSPLIKVTGTELWSYLYAGELSVLIDLDHAAYDVLVRVVQTGKPITHSFFFICILVAAIYLLRAWKIWVTRKTVNTVAEDHNSAVTIFVTGIALMSHFLTDSSSGDPIIYWPLKGIERLDGLFYVFLLCVLAYFSWLFAKRAKLHLGQQ